MNGPISLKTLLVVFILVDEVPEKDFAFSHPVHLSRLNTGRGSMQCLDAVWRRRVNVAIGISAITIATYERGRLPRRSLVYSQDIWEEKRAVDISGNSIGRPLAESEEGRGREGRRL